MANNPNYPNTNPPSNVPSEPSRAEGTSPYGTPAIGAPAGGEGLGEKAAQLKEKAVTTASNVADAARQQVATKVDHQKDLTAQSLVTVADGLRRTGNELASGDQQAINSLLNMAADRVDRFSQYLRSNSAGDFAGDIEQFARERPAIFFGGAVALGLLGARFLKSSSPHRAARRQVVSSRQGQGIREPDYTPRAGTVEGPGVGAPPITTSRFGTEQGPNVGTTEPSGGVSPQSRRPREDWEDLH